jgi:hypothetical protein
MFGLFRSASQRYEEAIETHIKALRGLDTGGLASVALYCSVLRLRTLRIDYQNLNPDEYAQAVALYYRPLAVALPDVEVATRAVEQTLLRNEENRRRFAHIATAQGMFGLAGAAGQTWRNTWLGCLQPEVRYLSREMWRLISIGFPLVHQAARTIGNDPDYQAAILQEMEIIDYAILDSGDGPDYMKIPEGFDPSPMP